MYLLRRIALKHILFILLIAFSIASCGDDTGINGNIQEPLDSLLTSFSPDSGTSGMISTIVTVRGKHFGNDKKRLGVYIGDVLNVINELTDSSITFRVSYFAMSGKLSIHIDSIPHTFPNHFKVYPTLNRYSPTTAKPGDTLVIEGGCLGISASTTTVRFGTVKAVISSITPTKIKVIVPNISTPCVISVDVLGSTREFEALFYPGESPYKSFEIEFSNLHMPSQTSHYVKGSLISQYSFDTSFYYAEEAMSDNKTMNYVKADTIVITNAYHSWGADKWGSLLNDSVRQLHVILDRTRNVVKRLSYEYRNFYQRQSTDGHSTTTSSNSAVDSLKILLNDIPYSTDFDGNITIFVFSSELHANQVKASFYSQDESWNQTYGSNILTSSIGDASFRTDGYIKLKLIE